MTMMFFPLKHLLEVIYIYIYIEIYTIFLFRYLNIYIYIYLVYVYIHIIFRHNHIFISCFCWLMVGFTTRSLWLAAIGHEAKMFCLAPTPSAGAEREPISRVGFGDLEDST